MRNSSLNITGIKKRGNAEYLIWRKNELQLLQDVVTDTYHKKNLGPPVSIGGPHYTKYNKLVTRISLTETVLPPYNISEPSNN
jgi:hypothetical protein